MLLHRYHNIEFILRLPAEAGLDLIKKAREETRNERIFQQWVVQLPLMGYTGNYTSFADYKDRVTGANIDRRSMVEIMAEIDEIERQLQEGGDI